MSTINRSKINQLISSWPRGVVYTQRYLSHLGYDHNLVKRYRKSGWIESIGSGAYKLTNDQLSWQGGLYAIQTQSAKNVSVGGKIALALQGYSHFPLQKENRIDLFAKAGTILPKWFNNYTWGVKLNFHSANLFKTEIEESITGISHKEIEINVSAPERAVLEMLYEVPQKQGLEEAKYLMELLITLRPQLMQRLLESCTNIKVKRLFLLFADNLNLPVFFELKVGKINLGSGKRQISKNGVLDKKYMITVPGNLLHDE